VVYFFLPDAPNKCKWFTARENEVAKARIEKGNADANEGLTWAGLRESLLDPWTWFAGILHFLGSTSFNSIAVFCSAIVKAMGFSAINAQGLQAPPFFLAWLVGIVSIHAASMIDRRLHPRPHRLQPGSVIELASVARSSSSHPSSAVSDTPCSSPKTINTSNTSAFSCWLLVSTPLSLLCMHGAVITSQRNPSERS
jgi:hypothetical protein